MLNNAVSVHTRADRESSHKAAASHGHASLRHNGFGDGADWICLCQFPKMRIEWRWRHDQSIANDR
jgi:hypothetical protein